MRNNEIEDDFDFVGDDFSYDTADTANTPQESAADEYTGDAETVAANQYTAADDEVIPDFSEKETEAEKMARKANKRKKRRIFMKRAKKPFLIATAVILAAALILFIFSLCTIKKDKVMNNVYIENLDVGGLSYEETLAAVNATYLFEKTDITLTDGKTDFTINGSDIGLQALPEDTAEKAFNYCKDGNVFQNAYNAAKLIFSKHTIMPAPQFDSALLEEKLNECGNLMLGERKEHYAEFDDSTIATIHSGQTGYDGDPSGAREQVSAALENENFTNIRVKFNPAPPSKMTLEGLDLLIYKDPVDARYEINGNEVNIIPGETGRYINKDEAAAFVDSIYEGCEPVGVPFYISEPEISEEALREKLFSVSLASYSTNYGSSTSNRCANIARAASLINGTVIAPGEVFSFNDTVGARTTANGFYTAKEYVDGQSVDGIGGGTCQVSSTLYSAVLYADMGIVERLNHMMSVGYIPLGQDATVSDTGVDFKFRNTSDYPIKISAYTTGGYSITVSILGTPWEPSHEVKISNSSSMSGENTVVRSTRYVYSNGELISTDTLNSSTYMPHSRAATASVTAAATSTASYDDDDDEEDEDNSSDTSGDDEDEEDSE